MKSCDKPALFFCVIFLSLFPIAAAPKPKATELTTISSRSGMTTTAGSPAPLCTSTTAGVFTTNCSETIRQVTEQGMSAYIAVYDSTGLAGCCKEFGMKSINSFSSGYIMDCQCNPGDKDSCYLESYIDEATTAMNVMFGTGIYNLITSTEIKFDARGYALHSNAKSFSINGCYTDIPPSKTYSQETETSKKMTPKVTTKVTTEANFRTSKMTSKATAETTETTKATTVKITTAAATEASTRTTIPVARPITTPLNKAQLSTEPLICVIFFELLVTFLFKKVYDDFA